MNGFDCYHHMPSHYIASLHNTSFPKNEKYNFTQICQSVFDRYYSNFVSRLQGSGYEHPPRPHYQQQFGEPLPASFIASEKEGLVGDAGLNKRWLVVFSDAERNSVKLYTGKVAVYRRGVFQLFGEGPYGLEVE